MPATMFLFDPNREVGVEQEAKEQVRRDAERVLKTGIVSYASEATLARHCLALLAKLEQAERRITEVTKAYDEQYERTCAEEERAEQAERERDRYKDAAEKGADAWERVLSQRRALEARLASVPALVEALRKIYEGDDNGWSQKPDTEIARDALTVYEQSQGGTE